MTEKKFNELDKAKETDKKTVDASSEKKMSENSDGGRQSKNTTAETNKRHFRPLKKLKKIK